MRWLKLKINLIKTTSPLKYISSHAMTDRRCFVVVILAAPVLPTDGNFLM